MKMKSQIVFLILAISFPILVNAQNMNLKITIGKKEFTATLIDSEASRELVKLMPLEVSMGEHNGNEKYYDLSTNFSGRVSNPGRVEAGDLMIWSSSTLVLFYADSSTYYSYIRIGKIDDISGLREAVGRGSVKVKFELVKQTIKQRRLQ